MKNPSLQIDVKKFQWILFASAILSVLCFAKWLSLILKLWHGLAVNWLALVFFSIVAFLLCQIWLWFFNLSKSGRGHLVLTTNRLIDRLSYYQFGDIDLQHVQRVEFVSLFGLPFFYLALKPSVWRTNSLNFSREVYRILLVDEVWVPLFLLEQPWSQLQAFVQEVRAQLSSPTSAEKRSEKKIRTKPKGPPQKLNIDAGETKTSLFFKFSRVLELPPPLPTEVVAEGTLISELPLQERFQWLCDLHTDYARYFTTWALEKSPRLPPQVKVAEHEDSHKVVFAFEDKTFCFCLQKGEGSSGAKSQQELTEALDQFEFAIEVEGSLKLHLKVAKNIGSLEPLELKHFEKGPWVETLKLLRTVLVSPLSHF